MFITMEVTVGVLLLSQVVVVVQLVRQAPMEAMEATHLTMV